MQTCNALVDYLEFFIQNIMVCNKVSKYQFLNLKFLHNLQCAPYSDQQLILCICSMCVGPELYLAVRSYRSCETLSLYTNAATNPQRRFLNVLAHFLVAEQWAHFISRAMICQMHLQVSAPNWNSMLGLTLPHKALHCFIRSHC